VEEYPRTLAEFERRFSTEEQCRDYLERLRWPEGFRCPGWGGDHAWRVNTWIECSACGRQSPVLAGTVFHRTRTPLPVWFRAMWYVTSQKSGASALGDEFTFRFNRRTSSSRGKLFYRLVQQAVTTPPNTYDQMVGRSKSLRGRTQQIVAT